MSEKSKEYIHQFLLWFLDYIATECNTIDKHPKLKLKTYKANAHFNYLMYKNELCEYSGMFDGLYTKHHYRFLTDPVEIRKIYYYQSQADILYTYIPIEYSFHDEVKFILTYSIPALTEVLYKNHMLWDEVQNDIEYHLALHD